jgi:antitoxin component of RelBE/YafQ-DinJ toxin-antitoxin module
MAVMAGLDPATALNMMLVQVARLSRPMME